MNAVSRLLLMQAEIRRPRWLKKYDVSFELIGRSVSKASGKYGCELLSTGISALSGMLRPQRRLHRLMTWQADATQPLCQ